MPSRALPESCSRPTPLFQGELFAIEDWRCLGADTPPRHEEWAQDDCVVMTRRGVWSLAVEGAAQVADPTTVVLWNRGGYRVRHPVGGGDECTIFRLTAGGRRTLRAGRAARGRRPARTFADRARPVDGPAYLLHRRAFARAECRYGGDDPLAVEEPAVEFLRQVTAGSAPAAGLPASTAARRAVERAHELISTDFRQQLTVSKLARAAGCSPFHLSRLFRGATGMTLHRAVLRRRLREGLEWLLDEPDRVTTIALALGFASPSHFTDAFRAEFRCSPTEARGQLRVHGRRTSPRR
ncbi:MAG TPA: AraC family transcriptional regulator [Gemmatimonadales bacterium]